MINDTITKREIVEAFQQAAEHASKCKPSIVSQEARMLWFLQGWLGVYCDLPGEMPEIPQLEVTGSPATTVKPPFDPHRPTNG